MSPHTGFVTSTVAVASGSVPTLWGSRKCSKTISLYMVGSISRQRDAPAMVHKPKRMFAKPFAFCFNLIDIGPLGKIL
jgi:hypothetical protein